MDSTACIPGNQRQKKEGGIWVFLVGFGFMGRQGGGSDKMHDSSFDNQSENISLPLTEVGKARV